MKYKILPIAGDASFRSFYRIVINKTSKIIVFAQRDKYKNLVAYLAVNNFLKNKGIITPKAYSYNYKKSIITIEDFGDLSFYKVLLREKNKFFIYKKLVENLLKMQEIKPVSKLPSILVKHHLLKKYSTKYLHKESDLFFQWYLPLFFTKSRVSSIKKKTKRILNQLYSNLNFPNKHFVHRDYHVQNLMQFRGKVGVIDSQDALIGNPAYDLASLVDDVRIKTSKKLKTKIYNYYINKNHNINKKNSSKFLEDFNILSVQRNLKIIGIFVRLYKRDKKRKYLKFIPYLWKLIEMRMKTEIFYELKNILDNNIPQKIRKKIL
tara:strand:+ start:792 stop:1754 length:963 start_codon:yes stop_codon:yes gene_type:complete